MLEKFKKEYLAKQLFFICDKRIGITDDAKSILEAIEDINLLMINSEENSRSDNLIDYFKKHHINIKIPCLLAYGNGTVYDDAKKLSDKIKNEIDSIKQYYDKKTYVFDGITPEIIFCVFPIESIERLRDKEYGFYAGLC